MKKCSFEYGNHPYLLGWGVWLECYYCGFSITIGRSWEALDIYTFGGLTLIQIDLALRHFLVIRVGIPIWWRKKVTVREMAIKAAERRLTKRLSNFTD